jgi:hypothetical protein
MNPPATEDAALLAQAAALKSWPELNDLTDAVLARVAQERGLEFATALLHTRITRHPEHGAFLKRIAAAGETAERTSLVGIVPGAFYLEHRGTGAEGARVAAMVESLGCPCERVPVQSFGSLASNAAIIADWLHRHAGKRVVLVSLSKGSADVKRTLALPDATVMFRNVVCWVSLSGLPVGTPLVAWLRSQPLRKIGVRLWLWWHAYRYSTVEELRHEADGPLNGWPLIPPRRHLAHRWAPRAYERLARLGPNDGGGFLLGDVAKLPGVVLPVWGADHYLQPTWDVAPLLRRVLADALTSPGVWRQTNRSAHQPSAPPASRSAA